jgi:hypothetical protein
MNFLLVKDESEIGRRWRKKLLVDDMFGGTILLIHPAGTVLAYGLLSTYN